MGDMTLDIPLGTVRCPRQASQLSSTRFCLSQSPDPAETRIRVTVRCTQSSSGGENPPSRFIDTGSHPSSYSSIILSTGSRYIYEAMPKRMSPWRM